MHGGDEDGSAGRFRLELCKWGLTQQGSSKAWARLGEILGETVTDSDASSNDSTRSGAGSDPNSATDDDGEVGRDENRNDWEHL